MRSIIPEVQQYQVHGTATVPEVRYNEEYPPLPRLKKTLAGKASSSSASKDGASEGDCHGDKSALREAPLDSWSEGSPNSDQDGSRNRHDHPTSHDAEARPSNAEMFVQANQVTNLQTVQTMQRTVNKVVEGQKIVESQQVCRGPSFLEDVKEEQVLEYERPNLIQGRFLGVKQTTPQEVERDTA